MSLLPQVYSGRDQGGQPPLPREPAQLRVAPLNLLYAAAPATHREMEVVLARWLPPRARPRTISPLVERAQLLAWTDTPEGVFADIQKSRAEVALLEYPEAFLSREEQLRVASVLFGKAVTKGRPIFVLSHSELIVLRVMKLIREHNYRGGFYRPEGVSIVVAARDLDGETRGVPVEITPDGELGSPWPGGFFHEAGRELS